MKKTLRKKQIKKTVSKKKQIKRKTGLIVLKSPVDPTREIVVASELADETLIQSELVGNVLPQYVYRFVDKSGKEQKGLSVFGVRESVRLINRNNKSGSKIRINPQYTKVERDVEQNGQKGIEVWIFAEDLINATSAWGSKFEPYKKKGKNGFYNNTFVLEVALSKAERNAMRKLMPEKIVIAMIDKLISEHGKSVIADISLPDPEDQINRKQQENERNFQKASGMIESCKRRETLLDWAKSISGSKAYSSDQVKELLDKIKLRLKKLNA